MAWRRLPHLDKPLKIYSVTVHSCRLVISSNKHLTIHPKEFIGNFFWEDFHIGESRFDIKVTDQHIHITNKNNYSITVNQHAVEEGEDYEFTK